jgi:hypothetical protein
MTVAQSGPRCTLTTSSVCGAIFKQTQSLEGDDGTHSVVAIRGSNSGNSTTRTATKFLFEAAPGAWSAIVCHHAAGAPIGRLSK